MNQSSSFCIAPVANKNKGLETVFGRQLLLNPVLYEDAESPPEQVLTSLDAFDG